MWTANRELLVSAQLRPPGMPRAASTASEVRCLIVSGRVRSSLIWELKTLAVIRSFALRFRLRTSISAMFSRPLRLAILACVAAALTATQSIEAHQLRASETRQLAAPVKKAPAKASTKPTVAKAGAAPKTRSKKAPTAPTTGGDEITDFEFTVTDCAGAKGKKAVPPKAGKTKKKLRMLAEEEMKAKKKKAAKATSGATSSACTAKLTPVKSTGKKQSARKKKAQAGGVRPKAGSKKAATKTGKASAKAPTAAGKAPKTDKKPKKM